MTTIDPTQLMNAVALGYLDPDTTVDALPALQAFVAACVAKGQTAGYVPGAGANKPGYKYRPITTWYNEPQRGLLLPPGFTLVGDGAALSTFCVDPSVYADPVSWPASAFLFLSNKSGLQGLGFNGQRGLIQGGAETSFMGNFVQAANDAVSDVSLRDIYCTGNVGGLSESFCISTGLQSQHWTMIQVRCRGNNGTGISLNGDMVKEAAAPGTGLNAGHVLTDCSGSGNTWQGMTAYGCRDTTIAGYTGYDNGSIKRGAGNGLNLEWCYDMSIGGGEFYDNVGGGIGGYGDNDGITLNGVVLRGNNVAQFWNLAEISFGFGKWWTGSLSGLLRNMTVTGGSIAPRSGESFHLNVDTKDTASVTFPAAGAPTAPKVAFSGVSAIANLAALAVTQFTNRSAVSVAP